MASNHRKSLAQQYQSSDSSSEDEYDFMGSSPPEVQLIISSDNKNENASASSAPKEDPVVQQCQTTRISDKRRPRKQIQPKKKDGINREIVRYQSSTKLLIPKLDFQRLVREILQRERNDFRMQSTTLECLHEAAESHLVQLFEDSYMCTLHRKRLTLNDNDMKTALFIRKMDKDKE